MLTTTTDRAWREDLLDRRRRLAIAIADVPGGAGDLVRLLGEVDDALHRLGTPDFSCCAVCGARASSLSMRNTTPLINNRKDFAIPRAISQLPVLANMESR